MATDQTPHYRLSDEQRARVRDCLSNDRLSLPRDRFGRLVVGIEASIARFLAVAPQGTFRDAHDALRELWALSHDDDPPVALIRARIGALPKQAVEYVDRRVQIVIARLFPREPPVTQFQQWAAGADRDMLVAATHVLSAEVGALCRGAAGGMARVLVSDWSR